VIFSLREREREIDVPLLIRKSWRHKICHQLFHITIYVRMFSDELFSDEFIVRECGRKVIENFSTVPLMIDYFNRI